MIDLDEIGTDLAHHDARYLYPQQVLKLCKQYSNADILEFGGGRSPSFRLDELPDTVNTYTVNDIDQMELDLTAAEYQTACFDVCGDVSKYESNYDIIISKMFAEHVKDGRKMHENTLNLLKKGGVAFHFMPKLYSTPLVVNRYFPEKLTRVLLHKIQPDRVHTDPKFPAYYSWCRGTTQKIQRDIESLGYSKVVVVPFYGHDYLQRFPVLQSIESLTRRVCIRFQLTFFSTVIFVLAIK